MDKQIANPQCAVEMVLGLLVRYLGAFNYLLYNLIFFNTKYTSSMPYS